MITALTGELTALGIPCDRLHYEEFRLGGR
jgi:ferredoxin-NADP reductase